jgi:hypothetical protein
MTQGEGPEAGPPVSPPLFGPEGLAEAKQRAGLGPRDGPPGGTVTDPFDAREKLTAYAWQE